MSNVQPRAQRRLASRQAQHDSWPIRDDGKEGTPGKGNTAKPARRPGSLNPRKH